MAKKTVKSAASPKKSTKPPRTTKTNAETSKKISKADKAEAGNSKDTGNDQQTSKGDSKMTLCTIPTVNATQMRQRRPGRPPSGKRLAAAREMPGKLRSAYRRSLDPCDNSNDSGLGFDHHMDPHHAMSMSERLTWSGDRAEAKRPRMDIKLETEEVNDGYSFPEAIRTHKDPISLIRTAPAGSVPSLSINNNMTSSSARAVPRCLPLSSRQSSSSPISLTTQLVATSRYMDVSLTIVKQPEQQHRARYQTEGSRGAVKDREGNGFPIVQLNGYYKPATLQVFIGTDVGKVAPHMFYQACKVSGKNSTPCVEKKIDGTCVIELQLDPSKEMSATCDCVGILKERNVDVEHRFPDQLGNRSKKKSTRCRMIFRTTIMLENGTHETLQVCSHPIVCTQPPGVPEICKKSLTSCPANGGLELFVLGKNFLKDTKVYFQLYDDNQVKWESNVAPDKEYLQQTHFVCVVPPYRRTDITEPVSVRLCVVSSGKTSESHQFVYTPVNGAMPSVHVEPPQAPQQAQFFKGMMWQSSLSKREQDLDMMPPPESSMVPLATRRPSISVPTTSDSNSPPLHMLKQEFMDESSNSSIIDNADVLHERYRHISESSLDVHHGDSNMSIINENSIDMMNHNSMMSHMSVNENSNLSINEDSVEMIRRVKRSRSAICENSVDMNSNMATINEDSSCSTVMHSNVTDRLALLNTTVAEKVMDLRTKMPMGTVSDLNNTNAPSMAALQRFGMIESVNNTLPTQSAQSVERYLTGIESKTLLAIGNIPNPPNLLKSDFCSTKLLPLQTCDILTSTTQSFLNSRSATEPVYLSSQRPFLSSTTQNDVITLVSKSEAAAVAENTLIEQTAPIAPTTITTSLVPTPINTEKLDALVNSTVESHIGSPTRTSANGAKLPAPVTQVPEVIITSQDVMLNTQAALMVPPIINTAMPSPTPELGQGTSLTSEVILNSQISPSLMCHNTNALPQDALLPTTIAQQSLLVAPTQGSPESISSMHSPIAVTSTLEPEKAVLLEAAVDFLETQKKICELTTIASPKNEIMTMTTAISTESLGQLQPTNGNNFVQPQFTNASTNLILPKPLTEDCKPDFGIPLTVKEITNSSDKKNDDRMISQAFTSLTENELINFINPSCFDQGNANYQ